MSAVFYMCVGLPASGKSYICENLYLHAVHISSDAIREEVFGDVNDQSHNAEVFDIMFKRVVENLKAGKSCIYDATNLSAKRRIGLLKAISFIPDVIKICLLVVPPLDVVLKQNNSRERHVPEEVIDRMLRHFEMPHKSEGWNDIRVYNNVRSDECWHIVDKAMSLSHDNPHHSASIGWHMYYALEEVNKFFSAPAYMQKAVRYHDIGKPYCKVFKDSRGNSSEIAHYYNHENVGAYFYISNSFGNREEIHIANLIQHHMDYFKGEKYLARIRERFGENFMKDLDWLHRCDLAAH